MPAAAFPNWNDGAVRSQGAGERPLGSTSRRRASLIRRAIARTLDFSLEVGPFFVLAHLFGTLSSPDADGT